MENLAYLHLVLAYESVNLSESEISIEQVGEKRLLSENGKKYSSVDSLLRTRRLDNKVSSFKLNFLIKIKSIALATILLFSSPAFALLREGSSGKDVVLLQYNLKQLGYYNKTTRSTGYFGKTTDLRVRQFQKDNGLVVDGIVGPKTESALNQALQKSETIQKEDTVSRTPILKFGSQGEEVAELQERLTPLSISIKTPEGEEEDFVLPNIFEEYSNNTFGVKTQAAVKKFQEQNNLKPDGIVGPKTQEVLNKVLKSYVPLNMSARAYFNRGLKTISFLEALQNYNEAIKRDKNMAEAYYRRGMLYAYANVASTSDNMMARDTNKALNDFTKAIKINSDYVEAYLERGIIYNENEDWSNAISDWTQAIVIEPENLELYYRRARAKENLQKPQDAINDYIKVIEIKLRYEQDKNLKKEIRRVINNFQNNLITSESMLALSRGIATASISDITGSSDIFGREEYGSTSLGQDLTIDDDDDPLVKYLRLSYQTATRGLENSINKADVKNNNLLNLLLYYKTLNEYIYQRIIRISSDFPQEVQQEIQLFFKNNFNNNDLDTANPNTFASSHYYKAILLFKIDKKQEAKEELDKAISKQNDFSKAYYLRGIIQSEEGNEKKAISDFQTYLQANTDVIKDREKLSIIKDNNSELNAQKACPSQDISKESLKMLQFSSTSLDASSYIKRGNLRFLLGDYPGAKRDLDKAIEKNDNNVANAYYEKGKIAAYEFVYSPSNSSSNSKWKNPQEAVVFKWKKAEEAINNLERAIKTQKNPEAYFTLAYLQYASEIFNKQFKDYNGVKENSYLDVFKEKINWTDSSYKNFSQSIELDQNYPQSYFFLFALDVHKKYLSETNAKDFELTLNSDHSVSRKAIDYLTQAISNDIYFFSDFSRGLTQPVSIQRLTCFNVENIDSSSNNRQKSFTFINGDQFLIENHYYTQALNYYKNNKYKESIAEINKAIEINSDVSDYYIIRAASYLFDKTNNNNYSNQNALRDLERAIELEPMFFSDLTTVSHFLIGLLYENKDRPKSQENYKKAFQYWRDSLKSGRKFFPEVIWGEAIGPFGQTQETSSPKAAESQPKK